MRNPEQTRGFWDYYTDENGSTPYMKLIFSTTDFWLTLHLFAVYSIVACVQLIKHSPPPVFKSIQQDSKTSNDTPQADTPKHADDSFLDRLLNWDAPISNEELSHYPYLCRFYENETLRLGAVVLGSFLSSVPCRASLVDLLSCRNGFASVFHQPKPFVEVLQSLPCLLDPRRCSQDGHHVVVPSNAYLDVSCADTVHEDNHRFASWPKGRGGGVKKRMKRTTARTTRTTNIRM